jgi:adenine-specific DNA-methyltransferase
MTLDDNEVHRARMVLDEVFGEQNFVATCIWRKNFSPKPGAKYFSEDHDYLLVATKDKANWRPNLLERTEAMDGRFENPDSDPRGPWTSGDLSARNPYSEGTYAITCPSGRVIDGPPPGTYWRISKSKFDALDSDKRIWWGDGGNNQPRLKRFLSEVKAGRVPQTLWDYTEVGHTQDAKRTLLEMGLIRTQEDGSMTPKPVPLVERVLDLASDKDSLVLDSFAGSGTTAHAVLKANAKDGGRRRFILVEGEDYADSLTAERVRRAIRGYAWAGTQRETLLEQKLTFTSLKKADALLAQVEALKVQEGLSEGDLADQGSPRARRFDSLEAKVDDGVLRVQGLRRISEMTPGLGGGFTYCTLGEPLDLAKMLSGERLPTAQALGEWLFHTATGGTVQPALPDAPAWYLSEAADRHVWLVYRPDLAFLKGPEAALTLTLARHIAEWGRAYDAARGQRKGHLVFAPAKYMSNRQLKEHGIDFAPLPFALYREG